MLADDDDRDARNRVRRWLIVAAAAWLSLPLLAVVLPDASVPGTTWPEAFAMYVRTLPMALVMLWAARLSRHPGLRANILTRAVAASSLVLAAIGLFSESNSSCVFSVMLVIATGRSLQLLGTRGLDDRSDRSFEPVRFRGVLILALILACADVVTLLRTIAGAGSRMAASHFIEGYPSYAFLVPDVGWTAAAAALMAVNVWGLLRLRTWALLSMTLTNLAIVALAVVLLAMLSWVAIALAMSAGIQLLLLLRILAASSSTGTRRRSLGWRRSPSSSSSRPA
jgi:hypothetical protein